MVNQWMSKGWLCGNVSTASSTIPMSCHYPVGVRLSQMLPTGSHLQLSSRTAAESQNFFKQISSVFTKRSHQGWDALQTPLQSVATRGRSLFIISVILAGSYISDDMYYFFIYSVAVHQRINTVWLTKDRASVESRAARWHPWWGLSLSWRRLKPQRVEPPVRVSLTLDTHTCLKSNDGAFVSWSTPHE